GDYYWCVPPDPGIATAALAASESGTPPGTAPAEALHTFTLDSSASRCFFRDSTTLTPLPAPVPVRLDDPSVGPVVASSSTVLPCPAVPSGSLSGLHLPSFSTKLVSTAALQDSMVTTTTPGGQRVSICTCTRTGRHLATFTRWRGSSLYILATKPPQVAASAQVSASGQVAASCSCRLLSHQTLLWHHRLGHPSLPRLRGMHSRLLVSGLPMSLPPLPPSPAPPCLPCVEGRQCTAPHSSSFPPTTAPLQTLHMDVWGPARVSGQGRERYFLLVVDDYTQYTTVLPLRSEGEVSVVLIPWIRTVRLQLRERFGQVLPVLRLHFDRGGEFSSDLLQDFCRGEGILQSFMLPDSPRQNGIAERRIGLVMEVARTSMIHAVAPHFLWPFAVRYAAHQLNLWPRVSLPETSPTLRWTGKVGDASVFRVWGSRAFVRDKSADKLSARAIPCVFLGFVPDAPCWQFYHPASRRVLPSQDVTFDKSVSFYRLFPYRSAPSPPPPLFLAPGPPPVDPLPPQGPALSGVSQVDPLPSTVPIQVAIVSGAAPGSASGGAASGGAEPGGAGCEGAGSGGAEPEGVDPGGADSEGAEPEGANSEGAESGGAEPRGAASSGGPTGAAVTTGAGDPAEPGAAGAGGAGAGVAGVGGPGAGGAGAAGAGAVDPASSQWQAAMDAEMASWKSTGTYVDEVPPPGVNIVDGMWIFRVKRPPGSPPAFKARYVARGFSQRQGVDYFETFSPTPKMTTLRVLLHVAVQRDYETTLAALGFVPSTADPSLFLRTDTSLPPFYVLVYVDDPVFASADTEALTLVKSELQKRHTCTDLGELRSYLGLQITRDRARRTITLTQSHMVHLVLQRFGFQYSSPQLTPLSTSHLLSAPPSDESVEPSGPYPELVGCLITSGMGLVLGGRGPVVLTGHADASWVNDLATQRSSQGYTFSLGSGSFSWRSTRSSLVLSSSCEAEIYAGAMAAQELRWLTYLLTDLGEQPRSPPVVYVDNKAMIALCQEHRLEHRTKHIALRYFLAREL
ncbi:unnamed protein product, partial [Closterium sp. NIES-53]